MKNKAITYLLFLIVAIVWGTIIYKIFFYSESDGVQVRIDNTQVKENAQEHIDTFSLSLNYPDPFLKNSKVTPKNRANTPQTTQSQPGRKRVQKAAPQKQETIIVWPTIRYDGLIKSGVNTTAIVTINGKSHFLKKDEVEKEVKLLSITKDSIIVMYQQKTKTIKK